MGNRRLFLSAKFGLCNPDGRGVSVAMKTKKLVASDETPLSDLITRLTNGLLEVCAWPTNEAMLRDLDKLAIAFARLRDAELRVTAAEAEPEPNP